MSVLAFLARLVGLAGDLMAALKARRQAEAARTAVAARQLRDLVDAMDKAKLARARLDERARAADGLRDDDGHRRD